MLAPIVNASAEGGVQRVALGVCTCGRPLMLRSCLDSLARQQFDDSISPLLIVVDNEAGPNNQSGVEKFAALCPFPVHYVHEPRRGISSARNALIDKAVLLGADWVTFVDDDEVAEPGWLAALMAPEYRDVPILAGFREYVHPGPAPFWVMPERETFQEGARFEVAAMGNVRISTKLFRVGLRFDTRLGYLGGEDSEFYREARTAGFEMRRTLRAVTRETVHPERCGYFAQLYRAYCYGATGMQTRVHCVGRKRAVRSKLLTVPVQLLAGLVMVTISPLGIVGGVKSFKTLALGGGKRLAKAAGRFSAMIGRLPQPYQNVVGQ